MEHCLVTGPTASNEDPSRCRQIVGKLAQFDRAVENFDQAIRLDPQLALAYYNRGLVHAQQGKKTEAIADLEKLITLSDNPHWIETARQQIAALKQ